MLALAVAAVAARAGVVAAAVAVAVAGGLGLAGYEERRRDGEREGRYEARHGSLLVRTAYLPVTTGVRNMTGAPALEISGLRRRFGPREVLCGLSMTVQPGDVYGFLGPNGAGKTTALRCALGLLRVGAGTIRIFGEDHPTRRRRGVGALVETPRFHEWMSGQANLEVACAYAGAPRDEAAGALARVGLGARGQDAVRGYSLGMKQRLGIARALLGRPRLLLLDEPTNGLDPQGMRDVRELIRDLAREDGLTVLVSSHLLYEIEAFATRVGILRQGRLIAEGGVRELLAGQAEVVEVDGPDRPAIEAAVAQIEGARRLDEGERGLSVGLDGIDAAGLNRALVGRGVDVSSLSARSGSLEDLFLSLTAQEIA